MQTKADIEEETRRRIAEEQMASTEPVLVPEREGEVMGEIDVVEDVEGHPQGQPPVSDGKQEDMLL